SSLQKFSLLNRSMSTTPNAPEVLAAPSTEELIANMVFNTLQKDLLAQAQMQVQAGLAEIQVSLAALASTVSDTQVDLDSLIARILGMGQMGHGVGLRLSISPLEKYDGASKTLADQFI
ncbi:hypothetical protein C0993_011417, partial [Termitomyces sp. T159_Od127]